VVGIGGRLLEEDKVRCRRKHAFVGLPRVNLSKKITQISACRVRGEVPGKWDRGPRAMSETSDFVVHEVVEDTGNKSISTC
jgi:hypothetical protein